MKKKRAKWGSKTRYGKALVPSDGSLRPYVSDDVRPRLPKSNGHSKLLSAKIIFATMIAEGQDSHWTPFIKNAVKEILFK